MAVLDLTTYKSISCNDVKILYNICKRKSKITGFWYNCKFKLLGEWIPSVINHLCRSIVTCRGNGRDLVEPFL